LKVADHSRRNEDNRSRTHSSIDLNFALSRARKLCFGNSVSMSSGADGGVCVAPPVVMRNLTGGVDLSERWKNAERAEEMEDAAHFG
jgi:hypothetical protein